MPNTDHHPEIHLTNREISRLLEPIRDHGHCWSFIAVAIIKAEKERRARLVASSKMCGPYGDWPKDGH